MTAAEPQYRRGSLTPVITQLIGEGKTTNEIRERTGCSKARVYQVARAAGVKVAGDAGAKSIRSLDNDVQRLAAAGLTVAQMADTLQRRHYSIARVVQRLELTVAPSPRGPAPTYRDQILAALREGRDAPEIAQTLGCSPRTVTNTARAHGLATPAPRVSPPKRSKQPPTGAGRGRQVTPRGEKVLALLREGKNSPEIRKETGCSHALVAATAKRNGLIVPPSLSRGGKANVYGERVLALLRDGRTAAEIAAAIGCSPSTVFSTAHKHGVAVPRAPQPPKVVKPKKQAKVRAAVDLGASRVMLNRAERAVQQQMRQRQLDAIGAAGGAGRALELVLATGGCKFPIGDTRSAEFHFCGAERAPERPYCAEHAVRCRAAVQAVSAITDATRPCR